MCGATPFLTERGMTMLNANPITRLFSVAVVVVIALSCNSDSTTGPKEKITVNDTRISGCGGFSDMNKRSSGEIPFSYDPASYCEAERLQWNYDSATGCLKLLNCRVLLDRYGEHTISAEMVNGVLTVRENDQPDKEQSRCRCECVYDFYIEIAGVPKGDVRLDLLMTVDDATTEKWSGTIGLDAGAGEITVIDVPLSSGCP